MSSPSALPQELSRESQFTKAAFVEAFKALGDENRLRAFAIIAAQGRICVGDLVTVMRLPQSSVSRHLRALRSAGLVKAERTGTWVFYALADEAPLRPLADALMAHPSLFDAFADDISRAASWVAAGGCCPSDGNCQ